MLESIFLNINRLVHTAKGPIVAKLLTVIFETAIPIRQEQALDKRSYNMSSPHLATPYRDSAGDMHWQR